MIKIFGILLIIFSGCGVGIYFSERLSDKVRRLEKLKYMTDEIMTLIRYRHLTTNEIVQELGRNRNFEVFEFENFRDERTFCENWSRWAEENNVFSDEERDWLKSFGSTLGESDTDGQISSITVHMSRLEKMIAETEIEYRTKGKLFRSLGLISGVLVAVLII